MNARINLSSAIRFVCPYLIIEVMNLSLLYVLTFFFFFFFFGLKIWNSKALRMYLKIIMTKSDISARYIVKTMSITIIYIYTAPCVSVCSISKFDLMSNY
jgi:hypothetical protein